MPRILGRLENLVGKDLPKKRKVENYRNEWETLQTKWTKNKQEFQSNANTNKAVVVQNSLG